MPVSNINANINDRPSTFLVNEYPCLEPQSVIRALEKTPVEYPKEVLECNCLKITRGREPATAKLLMIGEFVKLLIDEPEVSLTIRSRALDEDLVFNNMSMVGAYPLNPGADPQDNRAAWLVVLQDRRRLMATSTFSGMMRFNMLAAGGAINEVESKYLLETVEDESTPYTWTKMIEEVWNQVPGLGEYPGIPFTPHGTPEDFNLWEHKSPWVALNSILLRIGCGIIWDPFEDKFDIVRLGDQDDLLEDKLDTARDWLVHNDQTLKKYETYIPSTIKVKFLKWFKHYGTARDAFVGPGTWLTQPYVTKIVNVNFPQTNPELSWEICDDLAAVVLANNSDIENDADLTDRAEERVSDWVRMMVNGRDDQIASFSYHYAGAHKFVCSEQVSSVEWYDREGGNMMPSDGGMRTVVIISRVIEGIAPGFVGVPPFRRIHEPNFPNVLQLVNVDEVPSNDDKLFKGRLVTMDPGVPSSTKLPGEPVFLQTTDLRDTRDRLSGAGEASRAISFVVFARMNGFITSAGQTRPLLVFEPPCLIETKGFNDGDPPDAGTTINWPNYVLRFNSADFVTAGSNTFTTDVSLPVRIAPFSGMPTVITVNDKGIITGIA